MTVQFNQNLNQKPCLHHTVYTPWYTQYVGVKFCGYKQKDLSVHPLTVVHPAWLCLPWNEIGSVCGWEASEGSCPCHMGSVDLRHLVKLFACRRKEAAGVSLCTEGGMWLSEFHPVKPLISNTSTFHKLKTNSHVHNVHSSGTKHFNVIQLFFENASLS